MPVVGKTRDFTQGAQRNCGEKSEKAKAITAEDAEVGAQRAHR
jgi:hypothetical protein